MKLFIHFFMTSIQHVELEMSQIKEDLNQPRKNFGTDGDKNRLLLSVQGLGVQQPIAVMKVSDNEYMIVDGHRRFRVASELGLKQIPCRVFEKMEMADLERLRFELQQNRRAWKSLEKAEALARIKESKKFNSKELAEFLFLSESAVSASLSLRDEKEDYKNLMEEYDIPESYRVEFAKLRPKIRPIKEFTEEQIVRSIFRRVKFSVIRSAKSFRSLSRIFLRGDANEDALHEFFKNPDMTMRELERNSVQSGFSLSINEIIQKVGLSLQGGVTFSTKEKETLVQLQKLLNSAFL